MSCVWTLTSPGRVCRSRRRRDVDWRHDDGVLHVEGLQHTSTLVVSTVATPSAALFVGQQRLCQIESTKSGVSAKTRTDTSSFPASITPVEVFSRSALRRLRPTKRCQWTVVKKEELEEGWTAWTWSQKEPIPAYLVNVIVAKLDSHEDAVGELPSILGGSGTPEGEVRRILVVPLR